MSSTQKNNDHAEGHAKHKNGSNSANEESPNDSRDAAAKEPQTLSASGLELDSLKRELADCKDKYLRVLAESENARKRLQKEKQETIQYALQNVIVDFLNPIDHMENALKFAQQMSDDVKHWAMGFQMILTQFKDVLSNNGVVPFPSEGMSFDPHRHEAVETIETDDYAPGTVVEESLKGYLMGDKTIRPARVKVSKSPQRGKTAEKTTTEQSAASADE